MPVPYPTKDPNASRYPEKGEGTLFSLQADSLIALRILSFLSWGGKKKHIVLTRKKTRDLLSVGQTHHNYDPDKTVDPRQGGQSVAFLRTKSLLYF